MGGSFQVGTQEFQANALGTRFDVLLAGAGPIMVKGSLVVTFSGHRVCNPAKLGFGFDVPVADVTG